MEGEGLPLDMISNLPPNIIQTILTLMPMRDAFRTCILSRDWRYHCLNIPKLKFTSQLFIGSRHQSLSVKDKLLHVVYPILLLHHGPILDFHLFFSQLTSCCEIDQIIFHLSRNATVKKLTIGISTGDKHKLLSSFFNLHQLTHLRLQNCVIQPPSTFNGFSKLTSLLFQNMSITFKVLQRFISNCPLLQCFILMEDEKYLTGHKDADLVELLKCLPLIEHLDMNSYPIKCFAASVIPQKLPKELVHLKVLEFSGLCFARKAELQFALVLVTISPNIEKLIIEMLDSGEAVSQSAISLVDMQGYSSVNLYHLREIVITNFTNMKPVMDFVELILAKSPMLQRVRIVINNQTDFHEEIKMLKDLLQFERESTKARIIFKRP